jgi:hypothetical protein
MRPRRRAICLPWVKSSRHSVPFSTILPRICVSDFASVSDSIFYVAPRAGVRVLEILLPTLTLLLDPSSTPPSPLHTQALNQLLIFASMSPVPFKEATAKLGQTTREQLESSVRIALSNKSSGTTGLQQASKPQISLRSF